ncbi:hypothetical protein [Ruegeria hyattellae]|uniref:hypothetical protein n=1 Tax=Ruegeria hyattellae TaxID=3233337 RepID=UPI00355C3E9A
MKPAFALSLSFEGISLLHRATGGWRVVGEVALDVPDLGAELAALRDGALLLEPEILCKLVLPDDQIKYLSVETHGFEGDALTHLIDGAVDSATPYDIDDLIYDIAPEGEVIHVAAVARETLAEAESFAAEHGFTPVSFVAAPRDSSFPGEPFFGLSHTAQDWTGSQAVETDASVVVDIGPVTLPDPASEVEETSPPADSAPAADPAPPPSEEPKPEQPEAVMVEEAPMAIDPVPQPTSEPPVPTRSDPPPAPVAPPKPEPAPDTEPKKPRPLGLILTLALLVILVLVGLWATLFLEKPISSLFRSEPDPVHAAIEEPSPDLTDEPSPDLIEVPSSDLIEVPSPDLPEEQAAATEPLDNDATVAAAQMPTATEEAIADLIDTLPAPTEIPELSDTDTAVLDALADQDLQPDDFPLPEILDTEALYAETGLWSGLPAGPEAPAPVTLDDLYVASIDRTDLSQDPIALPPAAQLDTDLRAVVQSAPAIANAGFDLDARGLVEPTPEGARSPDGILIYLGKPPKVPPETPLRFEAEPEIDETRDVLAQKRPRPRPDNLLELNERARLGGRSRAELSGIRPKSRPDTLKIQEQVDEIVASVELVDPVPRPRPRPQGLAKHGQQSSNLGSLANLDQQTQIRTVAPKVVKPSRPSPTSVARQATVKNAISLRKISLIGIFGTTSNRRALVRMPNGRYKKVKVGDRISGGRVIAIGDSELRYQKSGRNVTLKMPKG